MQAACEAYVKGLLPTGNGYPQYVPEPNASLPEECQRRGTQEGDVGILSQDGTFDYLFNVTKPHNDPINDGRTPPDFNPIQVDEAYDMSTTPNFFKPGSHVASTSMTKTTIAADISTADNHGVPRVGTRFQYKCSVSTGAMAEFPDGGERRDLLNKEKLRNLALRCGASWYKHANGERFGRNAPNGSLYVVTGCDKTNNWGLASWSCRCKRCDISLTFASNRDERGASFSYSHENCTSATSGIRTGGNNTTEKNQCMFLRGFKVALREDPMSRVLGSVILTSVIGARSNQIIPRWKGGNIPRPYVDNRRWPPSGSSSSGSNSSSSSRTSSPLPPDFSDSSEPEDEFDDFSTGNSSVESLPRSKPYHPSNPVIDWLLDTVPDSQVVLVDDEVWMSVLEQDDSEMPDDSELLRRISELYEPRIESGGTFLAHSDGGNNNILAGYVDNPLRCDDIGDLDTPLCSHKKIVRPSSGVLLPSPDGFTSIASDSSYRNSLNAPCEPCQDFRSLSATENATGASEMAYVDIDQPGHQPDNQKSGQILQQTGHDEYIQEANDRCIKCLPSFHLSFDARGELVYSLPGEETTGIVLTASLGDVSRSPYLPYSCSSFYTPEASPNSLSDVQGGPYFVYCRSPSLSYFSPTPKVYSPLSLPYLHSVPPPPDFTAMSSTFNSMAISSNDYEGNPSGRLGVRLPVYGHSPLPNPAISLRRASENSCPVPRLPDFDFTSHPLDSGFRFNCDVCKEKFTTRNKLKRHRDAHLGIKVHPCTIEGCDKIFSSVTDRRRHETKSQMHRQRQIAIPEDDRRFIS